MGKPVGVLVRNADELAAVRAGDPFLAAPGKFTVAIFSMNSRPLVSTWHIAAQCRSGVMSAADGRRHKAAGREVRV